MNCRKCEGAVVYRDNNKDISLKCGCEIMFIRPDKSIKIIPLSEYNPDYKQK